MVALGIIILIFTGIALISLFTMVTLVATDVFKDEESLNRMNMNTIEKCAIVCLSSFLIVLLLMIFLVGILIL